MLLEQFKTRALLCGVELSQNQLNDINTFCAALTSYNERVNLVSRTQLDFLLFEHVLDSAALIPLINDLHRQPDKHLVDIGSGAGFPGLISALLCPELHVTMVEATAKKCNFLREAVTALKLENRATIINARAEELAHDRKYRDKFLFATARAVGSIELIAELAVPLLQKGGYLLSQKSEAQLESELASGEKFLTAVGAVLEQVVHLNKEALGKDHVVLVIKKVAPTPSKFPRQFSKILSGIHSKGTRQGKNQT